MPRKNPILPTPPAPQPYLTVGEVAHAAGRSPRELAQAILRRRLPLFVRGEGWLVAWNAVVAQGCVIQHAQLDPAWTGLGALPSLPDDAQPEHETWTVLHVLDDNRQQAVHGTLVARHRLRQADGSHKTVLVPEGRILPLAKLLVRQSDGIALVAEIAKDVQNLGYKQRHDTALRLLGVLLLMQEEWRLKVPRSGTRPNRLVHATGEPAKLRLSNVAALANLVREFMAENGLGDELEETGQIRGLSLENLAAYFEAARDMLNRSQDVLGRFDDKHDDA